MLTDKSVDFNVMDLDSLTIDNFTSPKKLNELALGIVSKVDNMLAEVTNQGMAGSDLFEKNKHFENVYIVDKKQVTSVKSMLDQMSEKSPLDLTKRNTIGSLLIAKAQLDERPVVVMPPDETDLSKGTEIKSNFGTVPRAKITLWDRFLAFFGIGRDKIREAEQTEAKIGATSRKMDSISKDTINLPNVKRDRIKGDNIKIAKNVVARHKKFTEASDAQTNVIEEQYFGKVPLEYFPGTTSKNARGVNNLPASRAFSGRSAHSLATCMMLNDGHSLRDICNPTVLAEEREQVGQRLAELALRCTSTDASISEPAAKEVGKIYLEAGRKFLDEPLPKLDELRDYENTASPYYLKMVSYLGFDMTQELERQSADVLANPTDRAMFDNLDAVTKSVHILPISEIAEISLGLRPEEEQIPRALTVEACRCYENELNIIQTDTIGEFAIKNQEAMVKSQTFRSVADAFSTSFVEGKHRDPISLREAAEGKSSIRDIVENSRQFKNAHTTFHGALVMDGGTLDQKYARAELANKMVDVLDTSNNLKQSEKVKGKIAVNITQNENFRRLTDVSPKAIKKLQEDPAFLITFAESLDPNHKKPEVANDANPIAKKKSMDEPAL